MTDLKTCPFCGEDPSCQIERVFGAQILLAKCHKMECPGGQAYVPEDVWNARAAPQPDETAALRAKLAEVERELKCVVAERNRAQKACETIAADRDEERKLADDLATVFRATLKSIGQRDIADNSFVIARHAARRKEQQG